jgi:hypothetical protein
MVYIWLIMTLCYSLGFNSERKSYLNIYYEPSTCNSSYINTMGRTIVDTEAMTVRVHIERTEIKSFSTNLIQCTCSSNTIDFCHNGPDMKIQALRILARMLGFVPDEDRESFFNKETTIFSSQDTKDWEKIYGKIKISPPTPPESTESVGYNILIVVIVSLIVLSLTIAIFIYYRILSGKSKIVRDNNSIRVKI